MAVIEPDKRKSIIVNEIEHWRRSKLLPEQYCDFLYNLYMDELDERPKDLYGQTLRKVGQATGKQWVISFTIASLIFLLVLYFNVFPLALQIVLSTLVVSAFVVSGYRLRAVNRLKANVWLMSGMVYALGAGLIIISINGSLENSGLWFLACCALIWIAMGIHFPFGLLHLMGWIVLAFIYASLLSVHVVSPNWIEVQIFWLPAALLFGWFSWFFQVRNKAVGAVFFASGIILWFMAEIYAAIYGINRDWLAVQLLLKMLIIGVVLFGYRQKWMEWVA